MLKFSTRSIIWLIHSDPIIRVLLKFNNFDCKGSEVKTCAFTNANLAMVYLKLSSAKNCKERILIHFMKSYLWSFKISINNKSFKCNLQFVVKDKHVWIEIMLPQCSMKRNDTSPQKNSKEKQHT